MRTIHGGGFQYESKGKYSFSPIQEISSTMQMKYKDIEDYNLDKFCEELYGVVSNQIESQHKMIYDGIIKATELTGNVVNIKKDNMSADIILDMIEKIEINFDDDGNPIYPEIHVGSGMWEAIKDIKFNDSQKDREEKILEQKREEWYAKKHHRKLSYID